MLFAKRRSAVLLLCLLVSIGVAGKRVPPKPVPPIVANGVQYSAGGDGKNSYVVATDRITGRQLWAVKVFHTRTHWWRGEEDNQWLFINDMKLVGPVLVVRDEKNRCYAIYVKTRRVKKHPCENIFSPQDPRL